MSLAIVPVLLFFLSAVPLRAKGSEEAASGTPPGAGSAVGTQLPVMVMIDVEGGIHKLMWSKDGPPLTLVFFFEFNSATSLLGLTNLDQLYRIAGAMGLRLLAVEAGGSRVKVVAQGLEKYRTVYSPPPFPVISDPFKKIREKFHVRQVPSLFVVDKHGAITYQGGNFIPETAGRLASLIEESLSLPRGVLRDSDLVKGAEPRQEEIAPGTEIVLSEGVKAPPLAMVDLGGSLHKFVWDSPGPELTIFFMWKDPCAACLEEMLFLDQVYQRATRVDAPLRIVGIECGGLDADGATEVLDKYRKVYPTPSYPLVLDSANKLSPIFGEGGLPTTFFLDAGGKVLEYAEDFSGDREKVWRRKIERILRLPAGELDVEKPRE